MMPAYNLATISVVKDKQTILRNISCSIPQKCCIALIGANGAGKTTLLRLLAGLQPAATGTITVLGKNIAEISRKQFARCVAYIPQEHTGIFTYTVRDFVVMGRNPHQSMLYPPSKEDWEYADAALEAFGLTNFADRYYTLLSSGELRLVRLAQGLAQNTPILLLDEPTANLDFYNEHKIMRMIRRLCSEKEKTVIASVHNPALALQYADLIYCIHNRTLAAVEIAGSPRFEAGIIEILNTIYASAEEHCIQLTHIGGVPIIYLKDQQ
ncbi:MAG: ABC transporter ATP-binding protein [Treponema sp.]